MRVRRVLGCSALRVTPITVDSPVPFKLATLRAKIETAKPTQASKQDSHNSILQKIDVLVADARLKFLMTEWAGGYDDPFPSIISQLIGDALQPRVIDLSGVPNEVAGVSSAVIARTLFNSEGVANIRRTGNRSCPACMRGGASIRAEPWRGPIRGSSGSDTAHCQGGKKVRCRFTARLATP